MGMGKIDPKKAKKFLEEYDKLCRKYGIRLVYKEGNSDFEPEYVASLGVDCLTVLIEKFK